MNKIKSSIKLWLYLKYINFINRRIWKKLPAKSDTKLLFFTHVNERYYEFAILYPLFALYFNPDSKVEITCQDFSTFKNKYSHLISFYENNKFFKCKVLFRQSRIKYKNILSNTVRFIEQPETRAEYVYIGDIDIILLESILSPHLKNIKENNLDFSNIKRPAKNRLSGLHFIEYDKMYPIKISDYVDLRKMNDEEFLYELMLKKGYKIPDENLTYRPVFGIHASYYSRPPLKTLTTGDKITGTLSWGPFNKEYYNRYYEVKSSDCGQSFFTSIKESDIDLRRIVQIIEMTMFYLKSNEKLS